MRYLINDELQRQRLLLNIDPALGEKNRDSLISAICKMLVELKAIDNIVLLPPITQLSSSEYELSTEDVFISSSHDLSNPVIYIENSVLKRRSLLPDSDNIIDEQSLNGYLTTLQIDSLIVVGTFISNYLTFPFESSSRRN